MDYTFQVNSVGKSRNEGLYKGYGYPIHGLIYNDLQISIKNFKATVDCIKSNEFLGVLVFFSRSSGVFKGFQVNHCSRL